MNTKASTRIKGFKILISSSDPYVDSMHALKILETSYSLQFLETLISVLVKDPQF